MAQQQQTLNLKTSPSESKAESLNDLNNQVLYVREPSGQYRAADPAEALASIEKSLLEEMKCRPVLNAPCLVKQWASAKLVAADIENFVVVFLDNRLRLIAEKTLATGTLSQCTVYPREVARAVLQHEAAAVILVHNHPSGTADSSAADRQLTKHISEALELLDVRLIDHLIIARGQVVSMAEAGEL